MIELPLGLGLGLTTLTNSKVVRTYTAQNAFGATRTVEVRVGERLGIEWPRPGLSPYRLSMSANAAKSQWEQLRFAVVGNVVYPFVAAGTLKTTPTINAPYEETETYYKLMFMPERLVLFNSMTREIIKSEPVVICERYGQRELRAGKCGTGEKRVLDPPHD
jgi:hypothetical protein